MFVPILRGQLTALLFSHLKTALGDDVLVGRGIAPQGGGWTNGQPGYGTFVPYTVLKTGRATTPAPGERETLGQRPTSWTCGYQLTHHADKESLSDEVGDAVRAALTGFENDYTGNGTAFPLGGVAWSLTSMTVPSLGASVRDDSTDPAHWSITDDVSLWLSKPRGT